MQLFINYLFRDPRLFFTIALMVVFSVCCHEFMHAWTALLFGDSTAAERGHLTLNPFKQMGWISLLMLAFIGLAWGVVPVDPRRMRGRFAPAAVALAGPMTNLVLSQLFLLAAYAVLRGLGADHFATGMLFYGAQLNLVLLFFNLLPVPPLDGWSVVSSLFPKLLNGGSEVVRGATFVLIVLLLFSFDKIFALAGYISGAELLFFYQLSGGGA